MMLRFRTRVGGALMLLLFLGGILGVSNLEALLFHVRGQKAIPRVHVEEAGADCHAEACLIGFAATRGLFVSSPERSPEVRTPSPDMPPLMAGSQPVSTARHRSFLPRSPPTL